MSDDYSVTEYKVEVRVFRVHDEAPPIPEAPPGYAFYKSRVMNGLIPCVRVCVFVYEPSSLLKVARAALTRRQECDDVAGAMHRLERAVKRGEDMEALVSAAEHAAAVDGECGHAELATMEDNASSGDPMDLLRWLGSEHRVASFHEAFQELFGGGLLTHRVGDDYVISDKGREALGKAGR